MRTISNKTRWLGFALACSIIAFTAPVGAQEAPPVFEIISLPTTSIWDRPLMAEAISDSGAITGIGSVAAPHLGEGNDPAMSPFSLAPQIIGEEVQYLADDIQWLPGIEGIISWGEGQDINDSGLTVGYVSYFYLGSDYDNGATLWLSDGTPKKLGIDAANYYSSIMSAVVNDHGIVAIGDPDWITAGVIVPLDENGDGEPDVWFKDDNVDGINDLCYPIVIESSLTPIAINESGQVAILEGYLVTPDFSDADGDGNPWFADVDANGTNDLLVTLTAPLGDIEVNDMNNLGQVVGNSGGHVILWEFIDGTEVVTDLGTLSSSLFLYPRAMNDAGQIVGTSTKRVGKNRQGPTWLIDNEIIYELSVRPTDINNHGWICGYGFVGIPIVPNASPEVVITSPVDGASYDTGALISFSGTASDYEDGDLTSSLEWYDTGTLIWTGGSFSTVLGDGSHTITASVADSGSAEGSDSVSIFVGTTSSEFAISGISPATLSKGDTAAATITGSGFQSGAIVLFENGAGVAPTADVISVTNTAIEAIIFVHKNAKTGVSWDVRVTNPDGSSAVLADGLMVMP